MVEKLLEHWNGGKKAFFSALAGAIIGALPVAVAVGEYKGKVDEMEKRIVYHLDNYTPTIGSDYQSTKIKVAVLDERTAAIQKALEEIKKQNEVLITLAKNK